MENRKAIKNVIVNIVSMGCGAKDLSYKELDALCRQAISTQ